MNGDETFQMEISGTRMMPNTNLNNTAELSEEEKEGGEEPKLTFHFYCK